MKIFKKIRRYLLAGFLVIAPTFITMYIIVALFKITDRWAKSLVPAKWYSEITIFGIPGVGLVILLALLIGVGYIASGWLGKAVFGLADGLLANTPVVSSIYSALKQLLNALLGENSASFRQVVFVQFPRAGTWSIGFVTGSYDEQPVLPADLISVFVPTTPNPTSGFLIMVPQDEVRYSSMTVEQALKMVVSLGITK